MERADGARERLALLDESGRGAGMRLEALDQLIDARLRELTMIRGHDERSKDGCNPSA